MSDFTTWRSLVDGEEIVVIPDSAVAQYDAQAISASDGDAITTWEDQIGSNDADGGSPIYRENGIGGFPSLEFDGSNDRFGTNLSLSQPYTYIAVVDLFDASETKRILDRDSGDSVLFFTTDGWILFAGDSITGSSDDSKQLLVGVFDGGDSLLREDGTETASGDVGSGSPTDIEIGAAATGANYWDGYIGEIMIYNDVLTSAEIGSEEERLSDKWGITI